MSENPILITGCARSGTSMVAGIIHICGAWGGKMVPANLANRKGMFENRRIRNTITKPFLSEIGADPLGQDPLPDMAKVRDVAMDAGKRVLRDVCGTLAEEGYTGGPWFYKGAKMCLIWPVFNVAFPDAKWIIVRRDRRQIAESCMRTPFMHKHNTIHDWLEWVSVHEMRFEEMKASCRNVIEVSTDTIIKELAGRVVDSQSIDIPEVKGMLEFAGLPFFGRQVVDFVDSSLFHTK